MNKDKVLAVALAALMAIPSSVLAGSVSDYKDIPTDWSKDAITWMVHNDYLKGDEGYIKPLNELTRAEMAAIINRVFKLEGSTSLDSFSDVERGSWYYKDMEIAVANGILKGDENKLRPLDKITRVEAFVVLSRALKLPKADILILDKYIDKNEIPSWAIEDMAAITKLGYVKGSDGKLNPLSKITRAEFSQVLYNIKKIGIGCTNSYQLGEHFSKDKNDNLGIPFYYFSGGDNRNYNLGYIEKDDNKSNTKETLKPIKPIKPVDSIKPVDTVKPVDPIKPVDPVIPEKPDMKADILTDKTKIVDLSWSQFVAIEFQKGYSLENTTIEIDGADITKAITKVSTDGSIVKWEITDLEPAKLVAKSGDKIEEVTLSENKSPKKPEEKLNTSPDFIIAHGPVAIWDYHLDRFDKNGNVRIEPARTTISLEEEDKSEDTPAFFSPDTIIDSDSNGEILIKFNNKTEKEKEWFKNITNAELVTFDEYQKTLSSNLEFRSDSNVTDGPYEYAALKIKTPQTNLRNNKRYYVRVNSKDNESVLVPIHLVNEKEPSLEISGNGSIFQNTQKLSFNIKDMTYGILDPISSVILTYPDGTERTLEKTKDFYLIGNKFNLYNKIEDSISSLFTTNGTYTVNIIADGFKPFKTTFTVTKSNEINKMPTSPSKIDAFSGATSRPTSVNGEASGSPSMTADIKFDADLLINAMIINNLNIKNNYAEIIIERWNNGMAGWDSVGSKDGVKLYRWDNFITAVSEARSKGEYLSFSEYINSDSAVTRNFPYAIKSVLEDGTLGKTQYNGEWKGKDVPELKLVDSDGNEISSVKENIINIKIEDENYAKNITGIILNGDYRDLLKENYSIKDGLLTINSRLKEDEVNNIKIISQGYKPAIINIKHDLELEKGIKIISTKEEYTIGDNIILEVSGSSGDYLKRINSIEVIYPDGKTETLTKDGAYGLQYRYDLEDNNIKIDSKIFESEGEYKFDVKASKYNDYEVKIKLINVKIEDTSTEVNKKAPELGELKKVSGFDNYYEISFNDINSEVAKYLKDIKSLKVGDKDYTKANNLFNFNSGNYLIAKDSYAEESLLRINSIGIFNEKTKVEITTNSYEDLVFFIENGKLIKEEKSENNTIDEQKNTEEKDYIIAKSGKSSGGMGSPKIFYITFKDDNNKEDYMNNINSLKFSNIDQEIEFKIEEVMTDFGREKSLVFDGVNINKKQEYEMIIKSNGYKDQTIKIKNGNIQVNQ